MQRAAGLYVRISQDKEGSGLGVERQEHDCRELAERLGWSVVDVYADNNESAFSGKTRPNYRRMLDDLRSGRIKAVLAWHTDRLHRSPIELEEFIDVLNAADATVHTVKGGELDLSTPTGRMLARQLGSIARYESEHRAERIRRKAKELADAGKWSGGGTRPFGYNRQVDAAGRIVGETLNETEALLIKDAAERLLAGEPMRRIMKDWNAQGSRRVKNGEPWVPSVMRRIMMSARIAGYREHHGEITAKAPWPAIIDLDTHKKLRELLSQPERRTTHGEDSGRRKYLLTGFVYCGRCGQKLSARAQSGRVPSMVCTSNGSRIGCGKLRIQALPMEETIFEAIAYRLETGGYARALRGTSAADEHAEVERIVGEIQADEQALREASEARYLHRVIDDVAFQAVQKPLAARIKDNQALLRQLQREPILGDLPQSDEQLRERWTGWTLEQRRAFVGRMIDRIDVGPGLKGRNKFDATRLSITWLDRSA